jgi:nitrogen fixation NifU-like protein
MTDFLFLYAIPWKSVLAGAVLIFIIIGFWTWIQLRSDPERGTIDFPDASAFVRGTCGDVMKISLRFSSDRVTDAKYWTDGCRMSSACGAAAAKLALHKTPEELADVDHVAIEKAVGVLPEEDRHCATLAAGALQEALKNYLVGETAGTDTLSETGLSSRKN